MEILLLTDSIDTVEVTERIVKGWAEVKWCKYIELKKWECSRPNIVILECNEITILEGIFLSIIKIRGKIGERIPILVIMDGTVQDIFSALKAGAYDYITSMEDKQEYKQKIKDMVLWNWYQKYIDLKKSEADMDKVI